VLAEAYELVEDGLVSGISQGFRGFVSINPVRDSGGRRNPEFHGDSVMKAGSRSAALVS